MNENAISLAFNDCKEKWSVFSWYSSIENNSFYNIKNWFNNINYEWCTFTFHNIPELDSLIIYFAKYNYIVV